MLFFIFCGDLEAGELQITSLEPFYEGFDGLNPKFEPAGQGLGLENAGTAVFEEADEAVLMD